jgi:hypothetical protein
MMKPMPGRNLYPEALGGSGVGLGDICMLTPTTDQHRRVAERASKTATLASAEREAENQ